MAGEQIKESFSFGCLGVMITITLMTGCAWVIFWLIANWPS